MAAALSLSAQLTVSPPVVSRLCVSVQVLADDRVKNYFSGTDMKKQRAHQVRRGI